MKKYLFGSFIIALSLISVVAFTSKSAFADGGVLVFDPYSDRWDYSAEKNQQAFINYEDGIQKMILSIGLDDNINNGAVWLFPVPADPSKVAVDILKSMPNIRGEEISQTAQMNMEDIGLLLPKTQLYTIPFMPYELNHRYGSTYYGDGIMVGAAAGTGASTDGSSVKPDVVVYDHVDKNGITSEIISARTSKGIYEYLNKKGLKVASGSISVLDKYIGKNYSFIASWIDPKDEVRITSGDILNFYKNVRSEYIYNKIFYFNDYPDFSDIELTIADKYPEFEENLGYSSQSSRYSSFDADPAIEFLESDEGEAVLQELVAAVQKDPSVIQEVDSTTAFNQKGVFVTFPTKKIFFPLIPTSVYGSKIVPATIRIIGHVSPIVYQDIKSSTRTEYFIKGTDSSDDDQDAFFNGRYEDINYTKVEINAPSKYFTEDLWFDNHIPLAKNYPLFVAQHKWATFAVLLVVNSILSALIAGFIAFKNLRKKPGDLLRLGFYLGLSNCFTIIGVMITTLFIYTAPPNDDAEILVSKLRKKGYVWKRKAILVASILLLPAFALGIYALPSLLEEIGTDGFEHLLFWPLFFMYALPILDIFAIYVLSRVREQDKELFYDLESTSYSHWTFLPHDWMKGVFVILFSIIFLLATWGMTSFINLTT